MDDLIELFADFEKKFLKLIKHLLVKPKSVFQNLLNKEKAYTKPFKFYSTVSSVSLFLILLSNRFNFLPIFNDDYVLPQYWVAYYNKLNEIGLTLIPILGFLFFIILLAILSFFLFRNPKKNFSFHFSYAMYVGGMIILFFDIIFPLMVIIYRYISDLPDVISFILVLGVPLTYCIWAYWVWPGNKILKALKTLFIALGAAFIFGNVYIDGRFEEIITNQLFYYKDRTIEIVSDIVPVDTTLIEENDAFMYFAYNSFFSSNPLVARPSNLADSIKISSIEVEGINYLGQIVESNLSNINLFNYPGHPAYAISESYPIDSSSWINRLWRIDEDSATLVDSDSMLFNEFSVLIPQGKNLLLTGRNRQKQGTLYRVLKDGIVPLYSLGDSVTYIDDVIPLSLEGDDFLFLSNKLNEGNLESVTIHDMDMGDSISTNKTRLFYNTFASIPAYFTSYYFTNTNIYSPKLSLNKDSTEIYVTLQIMTEKSFELQMFTLDRDLKIINQANFTTDYQLTYFDDYQLSEGSLYVAGRIFSIIPKSISVLQEDTSHGRPFIAKFNVANWALEKMIIIEEKSLFYDLVGVLYEPDIHLEVSKDSIHILSFNTSVKKLSIGKF